MTKLDAGLMTSLPASDPDSTAVWGSKSINPRPQSCLCLTWSGCPSNDDDDDASQQTDGHLDAIMRIAITPLKPNFASMAQNKRLQKSSFG